MGVIRHGVSRHFFVLHPHYSVAPDVFTHRIEVFFAADDKFISPMPPRDY
jgi:hypothetical protein